MRNLFLTGDMSLTCTLGIFYLFLLFVFTAIVVVGVKASYNFIKEHFFEKQPVKKQIKKKKKTVNSIEINPDEDTRIIFKKPS